MKKLKLNKNMKIICASVVCVISAALLIKFPLLSAEGIRTGLELCAQTMVPSLFPFLVISAFATASGVLDFIGEKTNVFFRKIFKISGCGGSVIFFGLWGGFPVGCSMASSLLSQNKITSNEAKRIILSSVNAGPAFVIGAVGTMMLSSFRAGVIMYISLSFSSVIIFYLSQFVLPDNSEKNKTVSTVPDLSEAFVTSVYSASKSMFGVCAWIIIFSCFLNIANGRISNENAAVFLKALSEVSLGCSNLSDSKNPALLSAVIGWSGLCVHCQVLPYVIRSGLKLKYFFCSRLLHAMLSAIISAGLLKIFPCEISVFSSGTDAVAKAFAVSAPAAAGLLIMCAIFILDLDSNKKIC